MGRPAKAVAVQSRHNTKAEKEQREQVENILKGKADKLVAPDYLTSEQTKIFNFIIDELIKSDILSNLDIYTLTNCAITIERIATAEWQMNVEGITPELLKIKESYTKDFFRYCNELCLSPQARAKIGSLNLAKSKEQSDPLLQIFGGENNA